MDKTQEQLCPLCGQENNCALAADKPPEQCWCVSAAIPAEALEAIPAADKGLRCICAACAGASEAQQ